LEVASSIRLDALSTAVQTAFGWAGYHLWVFETARGEFGIPDPDLGHRDAATVTLRAVAPRPGARMRYPCCTAGRRAGPPKDCGGVWGYTELLEILADTRHEEHEERLEWLGIDSAAEFDPAAFDLAEINRQLAALARP
jgi:hypothetical protein